MRKGKTLKIFVMGDSPTSLKSVELVNWTGLAFVGDRLHLPLVRTRPELAEPGIYMLLPDGSDGADFTKIYIGETDDFSKRIVDHAQNKDWWDRFIVFVSKDKNLTKAHVRYLERELHQMAKRSVENLKVMNSQEPGGASLPESDISSMQEFLVNIQFVLETLGLGYFTNTAVNTSASTPFINSPVQDATSLEGMEFYITLPKELSGEGERLIAHMTVRNGSYILKEGSPVRATASAGFAAHSFNNKRNQIIQSDAVKPSSNPAVLITTRELEFRSPSAAGAIVRGTATNGRVEWKRRSDELPLDQCEVAVTGKAA